ncbi:MAG TPA: flagellar hook-length control protein FliK, partial [Geobacterales bacterium]|nr:flagellar hook-length control protein FliK [Geobacterales bacterium]
MPQTLSAISHLSPRPAGSAAVKGKSQPLKDDKTFASLLGFEKPAKAASGSKKLRSGIDSSQAKTNDDVADFSQSGSNERASSQADASLACTAVMANQTQFIPAVSLASYIPISGTKEDVSLTQNSQSADASAALQTSRPLPQSSPKGLLSGTGATATAAQDKNDAVQSYETSGDKQASRAPTVSEQTAAAAAVSSPATDTAATSLKTSLASAASALDGVPNKAKPAFALAAADSSSALDTATTNLNASFAPYAPAMDRVPKDTAPTLAPRFAAAPDTTAKTSEAQSSPNLPRTATAAPQSDRITSDANSDGLRISVSDARSGITSKIAIPPSSADPVKAPDAAVVVRSQTHFVPEPAKAGVGIAGQTASSAQDEGAAAGQTTLPPSGKQRDSELSTSISSPRNDVAPKGATPALAPDQADPSQTAAFAASQTKAGASSAEQWSNMTADGSSFADTQAENPANAVSASRLNVTPNPGGGGNSDGGSAKDKNSHNHPGDGPSASADVPRSSEVSLAIPLGASGASPSTPAQQIINEIQRAIPAADKSQALTSALQPTLDGQQPLKTITVALSPASLGTVAVELSLKSGQLGVKLRVQEADTVQLLRQDGSLEKLLESAGYAVQSLSIHLSPQPSQPPQAQGQATANGQSFS